MEKRSQPLPRLLIMAPTSLLSPSFGQGHQIGLSLWLGRCKWPMSFWKGKETTAACLPFSGCLSLTTASPWSMQVTDLHHPTWSVPQRVASVCLPACEKGADVQLPHQGCLCKASSAKSLQVISCSTQSQRNSHPALDTAFSTDSLCSQSQDWK